MSNWFPTNVPRQFSGDRSSLTRMQRQLDILAERLKKTNKQQKTPTSFYAKSVDLDLNKIDRI